MSRTDRPVDSLPDEFETLEEAGEFWDTHDTMDYPGAFRTVELSTEFRGRLYEVDLPEDVGAALKERAKAQGTSMSDLAAQLLRDQLVVAET